MEVVRGKIHCKLLHKTRAGAMPLTFTAPIESPDKSLEIATPEDRCLLLLQIDTLTLEPTLQYCKQRPTLTRLT